MYFILHNILQQQPLPLKTSSNKEEETQTLETLEDIVSSKTKDMTHKFFDEIIKQQESENKK